MTREIIQRFSQFDDLELVQVGSLWDLDLKSMPQSMLRKESDNVLGGDVVLSDDRVNLAVRRGEQHHILSAIKRFEAAIKIDPSFPAANEFTKGQQNCAQALALDERQSDVQLAQAELYRTSGEMDLARYHYTKMLKIDPRSVDANMGLADIFAQEGNYQSAEELYPKATRLRPRFIISVPPNSTLVIMTRPISRGFEEALHRFETIVKMDACDHRLWGNIGDNLRFFVQRRTADSRCLSAGHYAR